ncbi:hypothetical protein BDW59DRAFT_164111 [Aspergillus cavernicola]|uniref:Myb-like DNA-binding domain-containing protein n=1 Tax=Aspergillus cavernicola TaxID=176166 RepID=A0ABR4I4I1_9EURO
MSPLKDAGRTTPVKDSAPTLTAGRRSKTMPTDSPAAKFLYTIIKQLDLKGIDWTLVASQLEISNGHAARMRYHRFRNQMEGITSKPRKKDATSKPPKTATDLCREDAPKETSPQPSQIVKHEPHPGGSSSSSESNNPYIKADPYAQPIRSLADIPPHMASQFAPGREHHYQPSAGPYAHMAMSPEMAMYSPRPIYPPVSLGFQHAYGPPVAWTPVKVEPKVEIESKEDVKIEGTPVKEEMAEMVDCE